jgi:ABC-type microcin C transport system permease subunit YejB
MLKSVGTLFLVSGSPGTLLSYYFSEVLLIELNFH